MKWISVKERLPNEGETVWVCSLYLDDKYVWDTWLEKNHKWKNYHCCSKMRGTITHWGPLEESEGWISIKDSLPIPDKDVQTKMMYKEEKRLLPFNHIQSGNREWSNHNCCFYLDGIVTHWMPLPEAPE